MKKIEDLNELAQDFITTMFVRPKKKRLKPLTKQITHNGITKKWTFDGVCINVINGKSYDWDIIKDDYIDIENFIVDLIKEEEAKK